MEHQQKEFNLDTFQMSIKKLGTVSLMMLHINIKVDMLKAFSQWHPINNNQFNGNKYVHTLCTLDVLLSLI